MRLPYDAKHELSQKAKNNELDEVELQQQEALDAFDITLYPTRGGLFSSIAQTSWYKYALMLHGAAVLALQTSILVRPKPLDSTTSAVSHWPSDQLASVGAIHYLMPATKATDNFCYTLASALIHDAKPTVLNWNSTLVKPAIYWAKVRATHQFLLEHTQPNDVVVFVDGYDNILQRPLREVVAEFVNAGHRVMFGAEKGCCCEPETKEIPFCTKSPDSPLSQQTVWGKDPGWSTGPNEFKRMPKYLNSGTMIAYAQDASQLYTNIIHFIENDPWGKRIYDDQTVFNAMYYKQEVPITLDFAGQMIKPMWACEEEMQYQPRLETQLDQPEQLRMPTAETNNTLSAKVLNGIQPWMLRSTITKMWPGFVHSGPVKDHLMAEYKRRSWWWAYEGPKDTELLARGNKVLDNATVIIGQPNAGVLSYPQICGQYLMPKS